jgi:phage repressor protein C with HTH and peptisase S24 domain
MSDIVIRFQQARLNTGLSQSEIADKMGISLRTYQRVEANPENLSITDMKKYMSIFGISLDEMITGKGNMLLNEREDKKEMNEASNLVNIPYLEDTYAAAGNGGFSYDNHPSVMAFEASFLQSVLGISQFTNLHIINAVGDSMTPTIISGELLFINPFENENNTIKDKGIYVISTPNGLLVKRIKIYPIKKMWTLISDNPKDDDIELVEEEIDSCKVIGRVVGHFDRI